MGGSCINKIALALYVETCLMYYFVDTINNTTNFILKIWLNQNMSVQFFHSKYCVYINIDLIPNAIKIFDTCTSRY